MYVSHSRLGILKLQIVEAMVSDWFLATKYIYIYISAYISIYDQHISLESLGIFQLPRDDDPNGSQWLIFGVSSKHLYLHARDLKILHARLMDVRSKRQNMEKFWLHVFLVGDRSKPWNLHGHGWPRSTVRANRELRLGFVKAQQPQPLNAALVKSHQ